MGTFKKGQLYDPALKGMSKEEINDNLEAVCRKAEESSYTKNLTKEELVERREEYSTIGIKLSEIATQKKEAADRFKLLEKEPKSRAKELVESIKYKSEQRFGKLFSVDDQEEGVMYIFDTEGMCIDFRPLTRDEKQLTMKLSKSN